MKKLVALLSVSTLLVAIMACSSDGDGDDDPGSSSGTASGSSSSGGGGGGNGDGGGGGNGDGGGSGNGSSSSSGSSSGSVDPFACQGVVPESDVVTPAPSDATPPTPAGGTIEPGSYQLTAVTVYGGEASVGSATIKMTLLVDASKFLRAFTVSAFGQSRTGADSGTYTTATGSIVATETCESGDEDNGFGGFFGEYTATATTLKVYQAPPVGAGGDVIEYVAEKR